MSSLMRLLSHRSSATAEGGGNNDTANAATGFASSATSTPRSGSSFPASPSINDFSMGTEADVAEWDTTTEKALPSPATSLGRVDGRRSLDSVLSTTSVFAGGAVAGMNNNNGSVTSSPLSAGTLSPRASLDSARGSADVRALLWRASMPASSFDPTRTPAIPILATMEDARNVSCNSGGGFPSPPPAVSASAPMPVPLSPSLFGSHAAGSAPAPAAVAAAGAGAAFGAPFKGGAGRGAGGDASPAAAPSTPRAVPVSASAASSASAEQQATSPGKQRSPSSRRRGGKIDGLDYYEYVELIRASSL